MKLKKLLIINSEKNLKINEENISYINIGQGTVKTINSKKIFLENYRASYYLNYKNKLIKELSKKIIKCQKDIPFFSELEIFNLRNDKNENIDLIINILIIKKIIKEKKFKKISLITDNILTKKIFQSINPKIEILFDDNNSKKNKFTLLKISKFYFKAFFIISFLKFFKKYEKLYKKYDDACLSVYPILYKKNKENFFKKKKQLKINFLLTDETHLNFTFIQIIKSIFKPKNNNLIQIENLIKFKALFRSLTRSYLHYFLILRSNLKLKVDNVDLSKFYKDYVISSSINRSKLSIYEDALVIILKKFKIKKFHLYMFEYNFGFFLINIIKTRVRKIKVIGYQHGIFSNKLLWLDLIVKNKDKFDYLPHEIKSFNKHSLKDYKSKINSNKIKFILVKKKISNLSRQYKKSDNKKYANHILVLPGTHDASNIYQAIKGQTLNNNDSIFYLKFHPKYKVAKPETNNIKIIQSIHNRRFFNVLISPTSTLVYDFMKLKKNFMV